ncbi:sensor histidine kinase [Actinoplanes awajinensis]|uniref:histidine kinase n=1 Tax=Actinoplanes awajinensis subsp. mycoplanecinus TaxID=135947 RepID=A0A101JF11_9ACTN|nr:nitrate- and nitrite sensing domain-containing protein [Actinoplanes awajinensis]KUL25502.1 hypothetical protein ADL15_40570 [Actinoplanes awajinensis subsp. mycoplanecinus]
MSFRTKLIAGLTLLVGLWAAAAIPALLGALDVVSARTTADRLGAPAGTLVLALETERRLSAGSPVSPPAGLAAQRERTDQARRALRTARDGGISGPGGTDATRQADALLQRTAQLPDLRSRIDGGQLARVPAVDAYTALIDPDGLVTPTVYPDRVGGPAAALSALSRSRELLAEQDALLAAMTGPAALTAADRARLSTLAGARRVLLAAAGAGLPAAVTDRHRALAADTALVTAENTLLAGRDGAPAWSAAFNRVNTALWQLQADGDQAAGDARTGDAVLSVVRAGVVGAVGLIAVVVVLVLARRSAAAGPVAPGTARAAGRSGAPAGHAALDPLLRDLERRNQGLLHRQLRVLDALARRETDDGTLGDLFRADHLANRMRRNLEKAITLSGGTPGRRWSGPVPLADVVRAAASEISEHGRVSTSRIEPVTLAGPAVTDLMHLLAELIENAATFAPAETRVRVTGARVAAGYRLVVSDVGPGMTDDDLATAARVLAAADPPDGGTWWGLYAAGRFAARAGRWPGGEGSRQDVAVTLRNGPDGGLDAEVLVPAALIGAVTDEHVTLHDLAPVIP